MARNGSDSQTDPARRPHGCRPGGAGDGRQMGARPIRRRRRGRIHLGSWSDRQQVRCVGHARSGGDAARRRIPAGADHLSGLRA